jgi:hypothetical protein
MEEVRRPDFSHPSMADPWARLLFRRMSEISEEAFAAGWYIGNEFLLWRALHGEGETIDLSPEELEELRVLSREANGWIWTGEEDEYLLRLVSFEEWRGLYEDSRR